MNEAAKRRQNMIDQIEAIGTARDYEALDLAIQAFTETMKQLTGLEKHRAVPLIVKALNACVDAAPEFLRPYVREVITEELQKAQGRQ